MEENYIECIKRFIESVNNMEYKVAVLEKIKEKYIRLLKEKDILF